MSIFPLLYFPPISFFLDWQETDYPILEKFENYQKQTLRNRTFILTANGKKHLSIPILHNETRKYKDLKISFDENWQKIHWKTLESSYRSSPFFEYYEEDLNKLIFNKIENLFEYNLLIFNWLLEKLKLNKNYNFTNEFHKNIYENDFRNNFKSTKMNFKTEKKYIQVFSDRFDFEDNLSILDFLCNVGPKFKEFYY